MLCECGSCCLEFGGYDLWQEGEDESGRDHPGLIENEDEGEEVNPGTHLERKKQPS
jgi:hypothetical protein